MWRESHRFFLWPETWISKTWKNSWYYRHLRTFKTTFLPIYQLHFFRDWLFQRPFKWGRPLNRTFFHLDLCLRSFIFYMWSIAIYVSTRFDIPSNLFILFGANFFRTVLKYSFYSEKGSSIKNKWVLSETLWSESSKNHKLVPYFLQIQTLKFLYWPASFLATKSQSTIFSSKIIEHRLLYCRFFPLLLFHKFYCRVTAPLVGNFQQLSLNYWEPNKNFVSRVDFWKTNVGWQNDRNNAACTLGEH